MKTVWTGYSSVLAQPIQDYLATKRSLGCKFASEDRTLRLLDRWLLEQPINDIDSITGTHLEAFLDSRQRTHVRSYNHLLGVVRRLFQWLVDQQIIAQSPMQSRARRESARLQPFLFNEAQIRQLLKEAGSLPDNPRSPLRGPSYEMIFALIATLGLRISEAAQLQCGDVDLERDVLQIHNTKFGKSRLIPFGQRLAERLRLYLERREQHGYGINGSTPLFSWNGQSAISTNTIRNVFRDHLVPRLNLEVSAGSIGPRVHSLRHSFAVRTLLHWYQTDQNPAARLHYLSTFMGHINPSATAVYLTITSDLLQEANHRFEALAFPGNEEGL